MLKSTNIFTSCLGIFVDSITTIYSSIRELFTSNNALSIYYTWSVKQISILTLLIELISLHDSNYYLTRYINTIFHAKLKVQFFFQKSHFSYKMIFQYITIPLQLLIQYVLTILSDLIYS